MTANVDAFFDAATNTVSYVVCDPQGRAAAIIDSVQKILALPDATRIFAGHDDKAPGRDITAWETTVGAQKAKNVPAGGGVSVADFVRMRSERDTTLGMPKLFIPSRQVNMRAGHLPPAENDGTVFLKVPVNRL